MADAIEKIYCTDGRDNDAIGKSLTLNWEDFI